jgi:RNA polymerase sigma factor (sigma-70 family)
LCIVGGVSDTTVPAPVVGLVVREPFEQVYVREFPSLVRLAMSLVDSEQIAEEVVQDAFARMYLRYQRVTDPVAYARVSVLNGARGVLRRRRVARRIPVLRHEVATLETNHVLDAVRSLSKRQSDVVLLRYDLQLTDVEIAATLGIPLGTVKSTMHRALARLREEITK